MGIIKGTAYPSRYFDEEEEYSFAEEALREKDLLYEQNAAGTFSCRVELRGGSRMETKTQRDISLVLAKSLGQKAVYRRKESYYTVGSWSVSCGSIVHTERFDIDEMNKVLYVFSALAQAGYSPEGDLRICFIPERYDADMIFKLYDHMETHMPLILQAFGLDEEDIQIIIDHELTFSVKLDVFDLEVIEACVYLLKQASLRASSIRNVRSQSCDMSNPRYQMRTWLLRLGFIGNEFERPRQTLMRNLSGDGAFYTDESRRRAEYKRKAKRLSL